MILNEKGILNQNPEQKDEDSFDTGSYLAGQYQGDVRKNLKDLKTGGERPVKQQDGILLPEYRLPTEAEWEYAALGLVGLRSYNVYRGRKKYPWDGQYTRSGNRRSRGDQLANFKQGDGDYGGIAGWSRGCRVHARSGLVCSGDRRRRDFDLLAQHGGIATADRGFARLSEPTGFECLRPVFNAFCAGKCGHFAWVVWNGNEVGAPGVINFFDNSIAGGRGSELKDKGRI